MASAISTDARSAPAAAAQAARGRRYGVFGVGPHLLGVPCEAVQEMFVLSQVHRPTGMARYQRGVAVLRGKTLPAIDLRLCLGLTTALDDVKALEDLLTQREQEHHAWLDELEASLRERRAFGLATDPRKCRFGQWYYGFKTDDPVLRGELARFEEPHAEVHQVAHHVAELVAAEKADEARSLIEVTRQGRLAELLRLFNSTRTLLRAQLKEIGVQVRLAGRDIVLAVDRAEAVTDLEPFADGDDPVQAGAMPAEFVAGMARWRERSQPVLLLDLARLAGLLR